VFELSIPKLLVLAVIALVIFGPDELPKIAAQAGRPLRDLRKIADSARNDLREELGPEFASGIEDLNPGGSCTTISSATSPGTRPGGPPRTPGLPGRSGLTGQCSLPAGVPLRPRGDLNQVRRAA
jgi:TatA/E family protein of Tat protein translocase